MKNITSYATIFLCLLLSLALGNPLFSQVNPDEYIASASSTQTGQNAIPENQDFSDFAKDAAPVPLAQYSEEQLAQQKAINLELADEFVLAYDHAPEINTFWDNNYDLPVESRHIDNEHITPFNWKWVMLEMPEPTGKKMIIHLRRPVWWINFHQADKIGNFVYLSLSEMAINGFATVTGILPSYIDTRVPIFEAEGYYIYRPITGWFERTAPEVWNYVFSTGDTIGSTPNHPFFSEVKQDYIAVGDLSIGGRVKLAGERTGTLVSKWMRENGQEKVYNLEVWRDHNFHVGGEGLLVHNNYGIIQSLIDGIHNATKAFHGPYMCEEYSQALRSYFNNNGKDIMTTRLQLRLNDTDYPGVIGFDMPNGTTIQIANNGFHEFTIINDKIFDNNIFDGMPISEFMNRLITPPGLDVEKINIY